MTFFGPDIRNGVAVGLGSTAGFKSRAFAPNVLFAQGEQGFWYDPSDIPVNWRRNLLTYTEQFDNAAWTKAQSSISANAETAPDGTLTADKLIEAATNDIHRLEQNVTIANNASYTVSVFAKAAERNWIALYEDSGGGNYAFFNVSAGTLGTVANGTATISAAANGFYRCTFTFTQTIGTTGRFRIAVSSANATFTYTGNGTSGIFIWGAQLERASTASDYQRIVTPEISFLDYQPQPVMYTDSAGTTPVTGVEQAVGLILDKIRGLVIGADTVSGWDLSSGSWTTAGAVSARTATSFTTTGAGGVLNATAVTAGKTYRVTVTGSTTATQVNFRNSSTLENSASATTGSFSITMTATWTSANFYIQNTTAGVTTITSLSVRELAGNHAIQPTSASRPTLRARYNLLTYSEQFDNAAWVKDAATVSANAALAPDGTMTADKIIPTAAASTVHRAYQNTAASGLPTGLVRVGVWIKADGYSWAKVRAGAAYVNVDLSTGVAGVTSNAGSVSITPANNGYYRVTYVPSTSLQSSQVYVYPMTDNNTGLDATSFTGDGTSGVLAWGYEVVLNNDTYLPYQRIAAATDYDTVGFPPYLAFDGGDDSLYTGGSIDFSATDKVTLWAGVTKLSDAALGAVAEISADSTVNNGAFWLLAPYTAGVNHYSSLSRGTANAIAVSAAAADAAPDTAVLSARMDISAPVNELRVDSVIAQTQTATQGTGNYGSYPLYIGRRNNASLPFNGRVYALLGRGAATSAALIQQAERWVASKQGRTL